MKRRELLAGAPATIAAATIPGISMALPDTVQVPRNLSFGEWVMALPKPHRERVIAELGRQEMDQAAETPVAAMFREWSALWAESERLCEGNDWQETEAEFNAVHDGMIDLERSMMAAPKVSVADIALAIAAATNFGVAAYEDEFFKSIQAEARALVGGAA